MAHLTEIYLKKETLETLLKGCTAKGINGISVTIATNDEAKEFTSKDGNPILQNVSAYVSQSKEDREAKKQKYYVGNGKVFWSDGKPVLVPKKDDPIPAAVVVETSDDLPF
jgi:hypothetical protein